MAKALFKTIRKYYKYDWWAWQQPSPTSNGTMGVGDFACNQSWYSSWNGTSPAYKAFSGGQWSTIWEDNGTGRPPHWMSWYTKDPIILKSFTFSQGGEPWYYYITNAVVQGSDDNSTWVDLGTIGNCYNMATVTVTINSTTAYKYHRIYVNSATWYGAYYGFRIINLRLNAQVKTKIIEGTAQDYDFYEDIDAYCAPIHKTERTYYKYQDVPWEQPLLTSNNCSKFSVSRSSSNNCLQGGDAWYAFATSSGYTSPYYTGNYGDEYQTTLYLRLEMANTCAFNGYSLYVPTINSSMDGGWAVSNTILYASNDGNNWTQLYSSGHVNQNGTRTYSFTNSTYYKYYRLNVVSGGGAHNDMLAVCSIRFVGTERTIVEGTAQNYDFYKDKNTHYAFAY